MKEKLNIGVIGQGGRGFGLLKEIILPREDINVLAVCDLYEDRREASAKAVKEAKGNDPLCTADYHEVLAMKEIDAVVVPTSWADHLCIAIDAMKAGKYVATEVGGAYSIDECWELVRTHEETGVPCMMLENCCYGRDELMVLNMVKKGLFGDIVHCQGGYRHELRDEVAFGRENRHNRQVNYMNRNCENYPTHELGFIAKALSINRGNRMLALTAMTSKAVGLHEWYEKNRTDRPELARQRVAQGDIAGVMIRCANGEMIYMTHDCTTPHPYTQDVRLEGAKGTWRELNHSIYIDGESPKDEWGEGQWEPDKAWLEKYRHPLWKAYEKFGYHGGHDGLDYLTLRAFVEVVQKDGKSPIDVYDAATWMAIGCLSEDSAAMGGSPVPIPDFTNGRWLEREPDVPSWYTLEGIYPDEFEDLK